jgi:hypothetical protein
MVRQDRIGLECRSERVGNVVALDRIEPGYNVRNSDRPALALVVLILVEAKLAAGLLHKLVEFLGTEAKSLRSLDALDLVGDRIQCGQPLNLDYPVIGRCRFFLVRDGFPRFRFKTEKRLFRAAGSNPVDDVALLLEVREIEDTNA